jgi:hypothetical protein
MSDTPLVRPQVQALERKGKEERKESEAPIKDVGQRKTGTNPYNPKT